MVATKMVSSPERVPTISGQPMPSSVTATRCAAPIAVTMAVLPAVYILVTGELPLSTIPYQMYEAVASAPLIAAVGTDADAAPVTSYTSLTQTAPAPPTTPDGVGTSTFVPSAASPSVIGSLT